MVFFFVSIDNSNNWHRTVLLYEMKITFFTQSSIKLTKKKFQAIDATGHTHLQNQEKNQIYSISSHGSWHKLQPIKWLYVFFLICVLMTQFNKSMYLLGTTYCLPASSYGLHQFSTWKIAYNLFLIWLYCCRNLKNCQIICLL